MTSKREQTRELVARRVGRHCSVPGCLIQTHQLSQWCRRHAAREGRHGSPTQRSITLSELATYLKSIDRFLAANAGHTALELVFASLSAMLTEAAAIPVLQRPRPSDWRLRLRLDLQRLHKGGVSGQEMFRLVAALHLFAVAQPRSLQPHSRPSWFQTSRLILNSRTRDISSPLTNRWATSRLPAGALSHLGRVVTTTSYRVLLAMTEAIERAPNEQQQRQLITDALIAQPLNSPSTTTNTTKETSI